MMAVPIEEDWRQVSDRILAIVSAAPESKQLTVFKEQLALLPEPERRMVEHFVFLGITFKATELQMSVKMSKHFHLSVASTFALIISLALAAGGMYLVSIAGDERVSKINIFGAAIETGSVGVACIFIAGMTFLFTIRSIVSKM